MDRSDNRHETAYLALLGRIVLEWSLIELNSKLLLAEILKSEAALVATAELGPGAINKTLNALATSALPEESAAPVKNLVKCLEKAQSYRNAYLHGIGSIYANEDWAEGYYITVRIRDGLQEAVHTVTADDLSFFLAYSRRLSQHVHDLALTFGGDRRRSGPISNLGDPAPLDPFTPRLVVTRRFEPPS